MWVWLCAIVPGCARWHYVEQADRDAYSILDLHAHIDDMSAPADLTVQPSPDSRLFDPTPVETPLLPDPMPRLHTYVIPPEIGQEPQPSEEPAATVPVRLLESPSAAVTTRRVEQQRRILLARLRVQNEIREPDDELSITPVTIPPAAWQSIPAECRIRMFEFESVRLEYEESLGTSPPPGERDVSPRLNFDEILHLALLNSREYQAQKEQLYRVALRLSLEEYDYQLKFAPFGNRTGVRYENRGSSLESLSRLDVPSRARVEALLGTGTALVTQFTNNVLLTFNGPDGFAADISSELLFELTHSVFQNDIRFERLTQAERNVIYAARSFARFRKTFYLQLAVQYYNLLRTNRQVEIDAQNYLSLVHVYSQREVEFGQGEVARVQIDQVEQNALAARSSLIGTCNNLENALDQLKIRIGLPTETPINLNLAELESLTLSDEVLVKLELASRVEQRLAAELARENQDEVGALNQAAQLVARMREVVELRHRSASTISYQPAGREEAEVLPDPREQRLTNDYLNTLVMLQSWLQVSEFRVLADRIWTRLQEARGDPTALAIRVPEVSLEFARSVEALLAEELNLAGLLGVMPDQVGRIEQDRSSLTAEVTAYETLVGEVLDQVQLQRLDELRRRADALAAGAVQTARRARATNVARAQELGLSFDESVQATLSRLLVQSRALLASSEDRLPPIDLDMDAASLSALVRRLDLANARGALFDEWRGTKLAADDLKSILDLQARQRLITQNQTSQPFELDFDENRTELSVTIDTPLNRRLQRNGFREQLLNYQLSRRSVMALEDAIKQDIRSDLRSIRLSREQHGLAIASAALAYERVISTELQLRLGVAGVAARDYLEAQTAYANSLSAVASRHISYILGRITLFTDLEQLQLDPIGRWPELHASLWNPELGLEDNHLPSYGDLPWGIHYSKALTERMQDFWSLDHVSSPLDFDSDLPE